MSEFPNIDKLNDAARTAREKMDAALQKELPPGAEVAIKSGPEFVGRYEVQEYPKYSSGQVLVKNVESGVERRVGYGQVKLIK
ncbi:hypothetical protein [Vreelandella venusta]|uniref:hypothetical protein n=1 Tax=Vreelandella venusta TaxID=44935 RepID=UPI0018DAC727|nr:hypothetical protein [Halomonas venusta]QPI64475.1 hypothetical protein IR195_01730 [Halomonas venusta]